MTYTIKLQTFEGPFDLLLFFIERDELDIYDIPIATITDDFLAYIRELELLNIDIASEFILMAATLMRIKAKMLIPRKVVDEEGNEIDPREALVQKLLEYKRYKETIDDFRILESERSQILERGNVENELKQIAQVAMVDAELESLTLFKLFQAFEGVMRKYEDRLKAPPIHKVMDYKYNVDDQSDFILGRIQLGKKTEFTEIFDQLENRMHAIVTFLALLDLLNNHEIKIIQGEGVNNFWLEPKNENDEEE